MNRRKIVKVSLLLIAVIMLSLCSLVSAGHKIRPNVVIIYGDDVGFGDVGVYGSKMIPTPNIDRLASQSLMFTDGHCTAAICSPSRFSLLTGMHGFRKNVRILAPNAIEKYPEKAMEMQVRLKEIIADGRIRY